MFGERISTSVGAITADDDDCIDVMFLQFFHSFELNFLILEFRKSGTAQNRTASGDRFGNRIAAERFIKTFNESLIAIANTNNFDTVSQRCSCDGSDRRIHAW